ncbi:MAG: hypothetical protein ACLS67_00980 [Anaerobutyricum soehngenii]
MENNITVNMENLSEEEREQLMKIIKKSNGCKRKVWKPECNKNYWIINGFRVVNSSWDNDNVDYRRYEIGNCFKTEKEAKFALEKLKVEAELRRFAEENNECEIDWTDRKQNKWLICYNYDSKNIDTGYDDTLRTHYIYFSSKEIAKQAIKHIGEERLKKYYFRIED